MNKTDSQIPTWWQQPNFLSFKEIYSQSGSPLLFIGSGISIAAGLPNWRQLLLELAAYHDRHLGGEPLLAKVTSMLHSAVGNQIRYQEVGSVIEAAFKDKGDETWRRALNSILNNNELVSQQSELHDVIAKLSWYRIITTNYDKLLENAAWQSQKHKDVIVTYPEKADFTESMQHVTSPTYILKIHGDVAASDSSIVLSKESFDELYKGALSSKYKQVIGTILRSSSVILFLGYSHDDPYVRDLFSAQMYQAVRERVFALVPREGSLETFEDRIQKLTEELQIKFITYSPDNHHQELLDFLKYFAEERPNSFDSRYREIAHIRKPTVVMLHCGGTIGSKPGKTDYRDHDPLEVVTKYSRYDEGLHEFSKKLIRWYQTSYNSGEQLEIDVLWEILPVESQMFSENASPELWDELRKKIESIIYKYFQGTTFQEPLSLSKDHPLGHLYIEEYDQYKLAHKDGELTEKEFRSDFTNRYIMGIIVLFGTDTLAFAASALSLSLQHLPCSVVITGANQPPQEENLAASRLQFYSTSDAWKNLMASLYFLQCFGHRLTEVFVCFGDTIHNSTNLRKRATEIIPSGSDWLTRRYSEPFSFRNLSMKGQYMFKLIDGLFCNNYYPSPPNPIHYSDLIGPEARSLRDLRHIRFDALDDDPPKKTVGDSFCSRVAYVEVSPCFPPFCIEEAVKNDIYAVLVEGYASGTYPSHRGNRFSKFLEDLYTAGIPVVLISRYGILASQQEYQVAATAYGQIPVLPLFGIVAETALPLLSIVTTKISETDWKRSDLSPEQLIQHRISLLREGIDSILQNRHNILSLELKNVTNRENMYKELLDLRMVASKKYENRLTQFQRRGTFPVREQVQALIAARNKNYTDGFVLFSRRDLLLLLDEFLHLFEKVEAGPDGLEEVFTIGFEMGVPLWESFTKEMEWANKALYIPVDEVDEGLDLFFEQSSSFQQNRLEEANGILEKFCQLIDNAGITRTKTSKVKINKEQKTLTDSPLNPRSFKFSVRINRFQRTSLRDEKYAVMAFSDDERDFFSRLSQGCPSGTQVDKYSEELKLLYKKLLRKTWMHSTKTIDWLLLGLFKGAACGIASFLRFDHMALRALTENKQLIQALRQRVKCSIDNIDEDILAVSYEYFELTVSEEETD